MNLHSNSLFEVFVILFFEFAIENLEIRNLIVIQKPSTTGTSHGMTLLWQLQVNKTTVACINYKTTFDYD